MRNIFLFMNVSLDGYHEAPGHDLSGFHADDGFDAFSPESSGEVDAILLGRNTYEMMRAFWPTEQAKQTAPEIAAFFDKMPKYVATHGAYEPGWSKVMVLSGDVIGQIRALKEQPGKTIIMFGSNTLCVSLLEAGLLDELQIMVNPVLFGAGTSLFAGLPSHIRLKLTDSRTFQSGNTLLTYTPIREGA